MDPQQGELTPPRHAIVDAPLDGGATYFVHGPAGAGKTTALQNRLIALLAAGVPSYTILILLPEADAADRYLAALARAGLRPYSDLQLTTFPGLARQMVTLFWPLIAREAGFAAPYKPPTFLSYDLSQVLMRAVIEPLASQGFFEGLRLRPQQILSQLLDNLNRSALNGLSLDEMEERQVSTWLGEEARIHHFRQAARAAQLFRQRCYESNALDLSLVVDVFRRRLLGHPVFRDYLTERYRHLLVDNLEESSPAAIELIEGLLPGRDSAVLIYDQHGGYKRYLAANPAQGWELRRQCSQTMTISESLTTSPPLTALADLVERRLIGPAGQPQSRAAEAITRVIKPRYRREMIHETVELIAAELIPIDRIAPAEIAIVVPYMDGASAIRVD